MKKWVLVIGILLTISPYMGVYLHMDAAMHYAEMSDNTYSSYQTENDTEKSSDVGLLTDLIILPSAISFLLIVFILLPTATNNRHLLAVFYQSNNLITYRTSSLFS